MEFADPYQLGVIILPIIEEPAPPQPAQGPLTQLLDFGVGGIRAAPSVTGENAAGVGVDHEAGQTASVEQDAVRGFGPDPMDGEESLACNGGRPGQEVVEVPLVFLNQRVKERLEPPGLDAGASGRADKSGQLLVGETVEMVRIERAGVFELGESRLDVGPLGVLGENGAEADFDGRAGRPPLLVALLPAHEVVCAPERLRDVGLAGLLGRHARSV